MDECADGRMLTISMPPPDFVNGGKKSKKSQCYEQ